MRILDKQEMHSQEQLSTLQNHLTQISKRFITCTNVKLHPLLPKLQEMHQTFWG